MPLLGAFVLLVASTVQACHFCELEGLLNQHSLNAQGALSSSSGPCAICLSTQPATSSTPTVMQAPAMVLAIAVVSTPPAFIPEEGRFSLYIRPPPSR